MNPIRAALCGALILSTASACGTHVYRSSGAVALDLAPEYEIDDDDIAKALGAAPQLVSPARIAVYSFDAERSRSLTDALSDAEGVEAVYEIPPFLVTGEQRYPQNTYGYGYSPEAREVPVKKLRLLAARAGCDLLVIADHGWRRENGANGLVALNVLLAPVFFSPFLTSEVESYLDLYVVDVRNGFFYSQISTDERDADRFVTLYQVEDDAVIDDQWDRLAATGQRELGALLGGDAAGDAE